MTRAPDHRLVILGGGQAAGRAAEAVVAAGAPIAITIVGAEALPPYERPALSKEFLSGADPSLCFVRPDGWYAENGVALRLGSAAEAVSLDRHQVHLASGEALPFDTLLIATGSRARRLAGHPEGRDGSRIFYLRHMAEATALRAALAPGVRVVVIGGGFIGLEVAAAARAAGCSVVILEGGAYPLRRAVVDEIGAWYADLHRKQGCAIRTHAQVEDVVESGSGVEVHLADGERIAADVAVIGLGVVPNAEIAVAAGLRVEDGIVVDEYGRTSHPAVFAAGDVTRHFNPLLGRSIRLETWQNAQNQAIAVARTIAGDPVPYAEVPWVWSDQYGVNLQAAGFPDAWDRLVWRGSPEGDRFSVLHIDGQRLVGAVTVNNGREMRSLRKLVAASLSGKAIDLDRAGDPSADLAPLARGL